MPGWLVEKMKVKPKSSPESNGREFPPDPDHDREVALAALEVLSPKRADDYDSDAWLEVGMILHAVDSGQAMLSRWDEWSRHSLKYKPGVCAEKWESFVAGESGLGLGTLVKMAKEDSAGWEPPRKNRQTSAGGSPKYMRTDLGNSERFIDQYGDSVLFDHSRGKWLLWNRAQWEWDENGRVQALAKQSARSIWKEAEGVDGEDERKKIGLHAVRSESANKIDAIVKLARSAVPVTADRLDADPWLLNCENGTIDLRTGELRPHRREDRITKISPVRFDPDATSSLWQSFINRIFDGDSALMHFVQRWLGYRLTGDVRVQKLPIFWGEGSNGKSTLLDTVTWIMGDYAGEAPQHLLTERRGSDEHPTEIAGLAGKRLIVASENEKGRKLRVQLMKMLTGNARLTGRFTRRDYFTFDRTFEPILVTNNRPRIRENTKAVWRRVRLVPFTVVIPDSEVDDKLTEKLRDEGPAVLKWLVDGCLAWQKHGIGEAEAVKKATAGYRDESDPLGKFIQECCILSPDLWTKTSDLRAAYEKLCSESGDRPVSGDDFTDSLKSHRCEPKRRNPGRGWAGIGLLAHGEQEPNSEDLF